MQTVLILIILFSSDLPVPEVGSIEDSRVTAGDLHTLQCTVTEIPHLAVRPTVKLMGPGGIVATAMGLLVTHIVNPVRTSDSGQYTCRVSVNIPSASVDVSSQNSSTLIVQSKLLEMMFKLLPIIIDCMQNVFISLPLSPPAWCGCYCESHYYPVCWHWPHSHLYCDVRL